MKRLVVSLLGTSTAEELYVATLAEHANAADADADIEFLLRLAADRVRDIGVTALAEQARESARREASQ